MNMKEMLSNYFRAGYPGIAVITSEEQRAITDVLAAAKIAERNVATWSATEGLRFVTPSPREVTDTADLLAACSDRTNETVYIFRDIAGWPFDRDPVLTRAFRDLLNWAPGAGSCVVVIGPIYKPHITVEKTMIVVDYSLPTPDDYQKIADAIMESAGKKFNGNAPAVLRALSGMSTPEAENALALSLVETGELSPDVIYREKIQSVKKSGLLEIIDADPLGLSGIGGLDEMKSYLKERSDSYGPEAEAYRLDAPEGILIVGVPGTGKSLTAKAVGTVFKVPTIKMDMGSLFNSLVGESESRTREALKLAEAMAPCVVWIDEIDKGLAGASGSGSNDSGVTKRVFGTIITWMQERKRPVFLVATANDVTSLPPELIRRWDEIFAVDLPNRIEREEIFNIQLRKRGRMKMVVDRLMIDATEGFTGSEIERVVKAAMFTAFSDSRREFNSTDMIAAARKTTPLSVTMKEKVDDIRKWAKTRARFASTPMIDAKAAVRKVR
jgi:ATP-dependent 26S proteasome regulatory subunit